MIPLAESLVPPPPPEQAADIERARVQLASITTELDAAARAAEAADPHSRESLDLGVAQWRHALARRIYDVFRFEGSQRILFGIEIARAHIRPGESLVLREDMGGLAILGLPEELPDGRRWTHGATGRCWEGGVAVPAGPGRWLLDDGRAYLEAR